MNNVTVDLEEKASGLRWVWEGGELVGLREKVDTARVAGGLSVS